MILISNYKKVLASIYKDIISFRNVFILSSIFLVLVPISYRWDLHKFIFIALVPALVFGLDCIFGKRNISLNISSLCILFLSIFSFTSYFYATNISLVFFPTFIWLVFFLWVVIIHNECYLKKVLGYLFIALFYYVVLKFLFLDVFRPDLSYDDIALKNGFNQNVISTFLLCLWPYTLVNKLHFPFKYFFPIVSTISLLIVMFVTDARGAFLSFLVVVLFYFLKSIRGFKLLILLVAIVIAILIIYFYGIDFYKVEQVLGSSANAIRIAISFDSLDLFNSSKLFGVGAGNLPIMAYSNGYLNEHYFLNQFNLMDLIRLRDHNFYTTILAENGIIGFSCILIPILIVCFNFFTMPKKIINVSQLSFIAYSFSSLFYLSNFSYPYYFSVIQFIGILSLSLSSRDSLSASAPYVKKLLLSASILAVTWFAYCSQTAINYSNLINHSIGAPEDSKSFLKLYDKTFNTIGNSVYKSLEFEIAKLISIDSSNHRNSILYFEDAIRNNPNNVEILFFYGDYLFNSGDIILAKEIYERVSVLQPNYYAVNLRLAWINILDGNCDLALKHINQLYRPWNRQALHVGILENMFFYSDCNSASILSNRSIVLNSDSFNLLKSVHCMDYLENVDWVTMEIPIDTVTKIMKIIHHDELALLKFMKEKDIISYVETKSIGRNDFLYKSLINNQILDQNQKRQLKKLIKNFGHQYLYYVYNYRLEDDKSNYSRKNLLYQKKIELLDSFKLKLKTSFDVQFSNERLNWAIHNYDL